MELFEKIKKFENLHIVFWLIKDSCWMLECRLMGVLMVIPTVSIAMIIVYMSRKTSDVYLNLAILFWISANSFWMYTEFFTTGELKLWATLPFALGFVFTGLYYYKFLKLKQ
jgi:hypothetical protein